jgi:hypothetical protein
MMAGRTRVIHTLRWLNVLATFLAAGAAAHAVVVGNWRWLAAAALVLVGCNTPYLVAVLSLVVAILLGAWPAAVAASLCVLAGGGIRLYARFPELSELDEEALASRVLALPVDLRLQVEQAGDSIVDSVVLLMASLTDDPERWPDLTEIHSGPESSEGGLVAGTRWTIVAAEAVLVAGGRPDPDCPVDVHLLAALGCVLPSSRAGAMMTEAGKGLRPALATMGVTPAQLGSMLVTAAKQPGGELIMARTELDVRDGSPSVRVLGDDAWRALGVPVRRSGGEHDR